MRRINYALLLITGTAFVAFAHHTYDPTFCTAIGLISLLGALSASV